MKTFKEYTLDKLTDRTVNLLIRQYIEDEQGKRVQVGKNQRACFSNIPFDIQRLKEILPSNYYNAVIAAWGVESSNTDSQPESAAV